MSDESTASAKKSRSLSNAERLKRRQKKILNNANGRLERITATHSTASSLNVESTSTLTSRNTSPQLSQRSSPVTSEAPDSLLSSRRNTENFEQLPTSIYSESTLHPPPFIRANSESQRLFHQQDQEHPSVSTPTLIIPSTSSLPVDDDHNSFFENEHFRRELSKLGPANSSTTSLASTIGTTSDYPPGGYPSSLSAEDLSIYDEINSYCQQQQQQSIQPFPFSPFLNIDLLGSNQQQPDIQYKLWQLIHFSTMIILGLLVVWSEVFRPDGTWNRFKKLIHLKPDEISDLDRVSSLPLFWYFVTVELILQSSRLFLQKNRTFSGSALGALAANLPPPISDALTILLRYNLIWNSLWEDICTLVFIIGFYVMISPFLSIILW